MKSFLLQSYKITIKKKMNLSKFPEQLLINIFSYTNLETMEYIIDTHPKSSDQIVVKLIRSVYFYKKYINHIDRALYCFLPQQFSSMLSQKYYSTYKDQKAYQTIQQITQKFCDLEAKMTLTYSSETTNELLNIFLSPGLSLPKLLPQNLQAICQTTHQSMLVDKYQQQYNNKKLFFYKNQQNSRQSEIGKLVAKLLENKEKQLMIMERLNEYNVQLVSKVYKKPEEVTTQNYQQLAIQGCEIHNFVVSLFAYIDQLINSWEFYLHLIEDPIQFFCEFNLRSSALSNIVSELQQLLAPVFKQYGEIVSQILGEEDAQLLNYSLYKPFYKKWNKKMKKFFGKCDKIFAYLLFKDRRIKIIQKFEMLKRQCLFSISHRNELEQIIKVFQDKACQSQLYSQISSNDYVPLAELHIQSEPYYIDINLLRYEELMLDIFLDQKSVNWCNHSSFSPGQAYNRLIQNTISVYSKSYEHIKSMMQVKTQTFSYIKQLGKIDTNMIYKLFRPVTISRLLKNLSGLTQGSQIPEIKDIQNSIIRKDFLIQHINRKRQVVRVTQAQQQTLNLASLANKNGKFERFEEYNSDDEQENISKNSKN